MSFELENNKDLCCKPTLLNIKKATLCNSTFRTEVWTGKHLQITVMSIPVGGEIGLERHDDLDQVIKLESGCAKVYMGDSKKCVKLMGTVNTNYAIVIPAGTWHNAINAGNIPLKVYSIYAPPQHPIGTIHKTKLDSDLSEE